MPEVTDVNQLLKDSAYAAIGFGVLGFQRAQVRRRELIEQLDALGSTGQQCREQLAGRLGSVNLEGLLDASRRPVTPESVAALRTQVVETAKRVDAQVQPLRRQVDERLDEVEELLPAPTRTVVRRVREAAASQEQALRNVIGLPA